MKSMVRSALAAALLALVASLGATASAQGATLSVAAYAPSISAKASNGTKKPKKPKQPKAAKKSQGGKVTFHDGSAESRTERDRRLMRECRGRSNSGVCEGYTRP